MKPWEIDYNTNAAQQIEVDAASKPWERDWGQEQDFSSAKPHQIFSIDGSNTNAPARLGAAAKSFHKNKKLHDIAVYGDSISKSVVRGIYETTGGIGSFINWYGDNMILPDDFMGLDKKTIDRLNSFGRGWQKVGQVLRKGSDFVLNSETLKLDEETFSGDFVDNPSFTRASAAFASAAPSLMSMAGLYKLTGSMGLSYFVMGGVDSADIYEASKEAGQDLETTNLLYTSAMGGTALIDRFLSPIDNVLGKKVAGKSIAHKIADHVSGGLLEATGEGSQTLWQNAVEKYGIDDTKGLLEGVIESAIGGFGAGAFATGAFDRANKKLLDKGATQEEVDALVDAAGMYAQKHPDELNDIAFQHLNQGLSNFEKFIEEHKGTPEAAAAMQKKADLDAVGKMAFDNLIKAGQSEKVAKAQSQIIQGISLWGSEETGLSPIEYINQRFPEVRREKFADFKNRFSETKSKADASNVDLFEALVNPEVYRKLEKAEAGKKGDSLLAFLKKRGGLKDVGGDLKAMDASKQYVGIINNKSGVGMDDAALAAWENGYFPSMMERPTIQDLKDAIREELFGNKRYAYQDGENRSFVDDVNGLAEAFDMLGIDYSKMSAREAEKAYNEAVDNYNSKTEDAQSMPQEWDDIPFQTVLAKKTDVSTKKDVEAMRADAEKYLKEVIRKQNIKHPELGKIRVSGKGIKEFLHNTGNIDKLALVPHLKELIETSTVGEKEDLTHERKDGIVAFYPLHNDAIIDGKPYDVTTKIGVDRNGNLFYTILLDEKYSSESGGAETQSAVANEAINLNITPSEENVKEKPSFQSAFAGSRVDYDEPSLEAIGSGEGHAAHGWGLYYALNKDIAEDYRKRFVKTLQNAKYDGKDIFDTPLSEFATQPELLETLFVKGKEAAIERLNKRKENAEKIIKTMKSSGLKEGSRIFLNNFDKYMDILQSLDESKMSAPKGQVHEVDLPENPYLLDEQKPFSEQSDLVKQAIREVEKELGNDVLLFGEETDGKDIYGNLAYKLGSPKAASQLLEKYGIKGITYDGKQDGRCFVIFNPADVKVIQKFYQGEDSNPRGAFYDNVIYLFEKANASTFMHETAHWFRNELKGFNSDKSRALLDKVNKWETEEFARHYKTDLHNGRYVVRDNLGNIVYDQNFQSKEQAQEYTQNELFARGFEAYLKEGKSPNSYMKQAFKSFWNWLRHLYRSAKSLNVDLNDDIRAVYEDIIGGEDIDFYMNAPSEEVIQHRLELQKEREKELDDMIGQAVSQSKEAHRNIFSSFVAERTNSLKDRAKWWTQAIVPISTRAARVNPRLKNKLRAYDYRLNQKLNERLNSIKPFLDIWATFSNEDMAAFDFALKNQYIKKQNEILKKYKAEEQFASVKALLESLYNEAGDVRVEMGYKADYFPRQVEDVEGLMTYLHGSEMASDLRRAEKEAGFENMTPEEQSDFINKFLRGYNRKDTTAPLPSNIKQRRIDIVTPELNIFYKPSMQALTNYVERMNAAIESRKFWGFNMENIDDSIGAFVDDMIQNGEIRPDQDKEVENILRARFKARGVSNKSLSFYKNMSYLYTMGGINSAITQIDDISVALYKAGFWNTVNSILHKNRAGLSREELGLSKIGQEFMEASTSSKAVDKVFKLTGLDAIDGFGKNVLINATFEKFQKMAKTNEETLRARIEPIMEQETAQTIEDIKNGEISDNVKLLMFNELADMQPISLSEMPEWYLTSGNGRVMYMLKTFMLKRIDIFRNECFDKIKTGQTKEGLQNLFKLASLMILCGASKDAIIDLMFGRKTDLGDTFVNNALGLFGFTKYQLYKARDEGFEGFASSFIPPLFAFWGDLGRDVSKKLFSKNGKDIKDFEIWKGVPIVGRFYYWWLGGGHTKEQKKHKKKLK